MEKMLVNLLLVFLLLRLSIYALWNCSIVVLKSDDVAVVIVVENEDNRSLLFSLMLHVCVNDSLAIILILYTLKCTCTHWIHSPPVHANACHIMIVNLSAQIWILLCVCVCGTTFMLDTWLIRHLIWARSFFKPLVYVCTMAHFLAAYPLTLTSTRSFIQTFIHIS